MKFEESLKICDSNDSNGSEAFVVLTILRIWYCGFDDFEDMTLWF